MSKISAKQSIKKGQLDPMPSPNDQKFKEQLMKSYQFGTPKIAQQSRLHDSKIVPFSVSLQYDEQAINNRFIDIQKQLNKSNPHSRTLIFEDMYNSISSTKSQLKNSKPSKQKVESNVQAETELDQHERIILENFKQLSLLNSPSNGTDTYTQKQLTELKIIQQQQEEERINAQYEELIQKRKQQEEQKKLKMKEEIDKINEQLTEERIQFMKYREELQKEQEMLKERKQIHLQLQQMEKKEQQQQHLEYIEQLQEDEERMVNEQLVKELRNETIIRRRKERNQAKLLEHQQEYILRQSGQMPVEEKQEQSQVTIISHDLLVKDEVDSNNEVLDEQKVKSGSKNTENQLETAQQIDEAQINENDKVAVSEQIDQASCDKENEEQGEKLDQDDQHPETHEETQEEENQIIQQQNDIPQEQQNTIITENTIAQDQEIIEIDQQKETEQQELIDDQPTEMLNQNAEIKNNCQNNDLQAINVIQNELAEKESKQNESGQVCKEQQQQEQQLVMASEEKQNKKLEQYELLQYDLETNKKDQQAVCENLLNKEQLIEKEQLERTEEQEESQEQEQVLQIPATTNQESHQYADVAQELDANALSVTTAHCNLPNDPEPLLIENKYQEFDNLIITLASQLKTCEQQQEKTLYQYAIENEIKLQYNVQQDNFQELTDQIKQNLQLLTNYLEKVIQDEQYLKTLTQFTSSLIEQFRTVQTPNGCAELLERASQYMNEIRI